MDCKRLLPLSYKAGTDLVKLLGLQLWLCPLGPGWSWGWGQEKKCSHVSPSVLGWRVRPHLRLHLWGIRGPVLCPVYPSDQGQMLPAQFSEAKAWG